MPELRLDSVGRQPRLYEIVSERLLAAVREAGLVAGDRIPSERDLAEQFGVSRTVIREAVRHLAAKGILDARSGAGVAVAAVDSTNVSESITNYLVQRDAIDPAKINEVRQCLELRTVELAAHRADDTQLRRIRSRCEELDGLGNDPEGASLADLEFHRAIAEATGNELFPALVDSLGDVMMSIRRATLVDPQRTRDTLEQHRRIAEALERRDPAGAVAAMRDHLDDSLRALTHALGHHPEDPT